MAFKIEGPGPQEKWLDHVRDEIIELRNRDEPISEDEFQELPLNAWEREYLLPNLTDEALYNLTERAQSHFREENPYTPADHYRDAIIYRYLPEIMRRQSKLCSNDSFYYAIDFPQNKDSND